MTSSMAQTTAHAPINPLGDADAAATDPDAAFIRANTTVSSATHSRLMAEHLAAEHIAREAERAKCEAALARRAETVANAGAALRAYHEAEAASDQAAVERALTELGVWWVTAQAHGASPADINAAAGGAK